MLCTALQSALPFSGSGGRECRCTTRSSGAIFRRRSRLRTSSCTAGARTGGCTSTTPSLARWRPCSSTGRIAATSRPCATSPGTPGSRSSAPPHGTAASLAGTRNARLEASPRDYGAAQAQPRGRRQARDLAALQERPQNPHLLLACARKGPARAKSPQAGRNFRGSTRSCATPMLASPRSAPAPPPARPLIKHGLTSWRCTCSCSCRPCPQDRREFSHSPFLLGCAESLPAQQATNAHGSFTECELGIIFRAHRTKGGSMRGKRVA
jgi:hypothetical protein